MPVLGMGGLFFRARDPDALSAWYKEHLGVGAGCNASGEGEPNEWYWQTAGGPMVFAPFKADTDYFPADRAFMINLRVSGLDAMLDALRAAGIEIVTKAEWDAQWAASRASTTPKAMQSSYGSRRPRAERPKADSAVRCRPRLLSPLANFWENFPKLGGAVSAPDGIAPPDRRISAVFPVWHALCNSSDIAAEWFRGWFREDRKMTYANLTQLATSIVAALVVSTIFVSAAVGPAAQLI